MTKLFIAAILLVPAFAQAVVLSTVTPGGLSNAITFTPTAGTTPEIRTASIGNDTSTAPTGGHALVINAGLTGALDLNTISSGPIVMGLNPSTYVGIQTASPALPLDVNGSAQFGAGAQKSTFTATGSLHIAASSHLKLTGATGYITASSSVTATAFFGDGSHLTGIASGFNGGTVANQTTFLSSATIEDANPADIYAFQVSTDGVPADDLVQVSTQGNIGLANTIYVDQRNNVTSISNQPGNLASGNIAGITGTFSSSYDDGLGGATGQASFFNIGYSTFGYNDGFPLGESAMSYAFSLFDSAGSGPAGGYFPLLFVSTSSLSYFGNTATNPAVFSVDGSGDLAVFGETHLDGYNINTNGFGQLQVSTLIVNGQAIIDNTLGVSSTAFIGLVTQIRYDGSAQFGSTVTIPNPLNSGISLYQSGDAFIPGNLTVGSISGNAANLTNFAIVAATETVGGNLASTSFVPVAAVTVALRGGRPLTVTASININNGSSSPSTYTCQMMQNGVAIGLADRLQTVGNSSFGSLPMQYTVTSSPSGTATYLMQCESSSSTGTQIASDAAITIEEF